ILRVSANGGKPETIVTLKSGEVAHGPQLIQNVDTLLFTLRTASVSWDNAQVVVQSLKSGNRKVIFTGGGDARYFPTGHLIYALGNILLTLPFDTKKLEVIGGPVPILEGVSRSVSTAAAHFTTSMDGTLAYVPGTNGGTEVNLFLVDKMGRRKALNMETAA